MWKATRQSNKVPQQPIMQKPIVGARKFGNDITANHNNAVRNNGAPVKKLAAHGHANVATTDTRRVMRDVVRIENIDAPDAHNPQCVADYSHEIHQYFRQVEKIHMPIANYMDKHQHINVKMRAILVDWLIEVHLKFKLMPETLYLTVNLIDRYLARQTCARRKLQLVGVTCMLLASKYEEIYFPEVRDFVYITDKAYSREEILRMEGVVLNTLKFDLTVATPLVFLKRFLKAAKADEHTSNLAHFFTERMLQEYNMLKFTPSIIAASAVSMALRVCHRPCWSPTLQHYATYTELDLKSCIANMSHIIKNSSKHSLQAVRKKFSSQRKGKVSLASFSMLD
jgi:cyclin B